jgi:uncharacterized protein (DUF433 family)
MDWQQRIEIKKEVLCGKAVVKGMRLSVEHLVGLLAQGWKEADVLDAYPGLTRDDLLACLKYAAEAVANEQLFPLET